MAFTTRTRSYGDQCEIERTRRSPDGGGPSAFSSALPAASPLRRGRGRCRGSTCARSAAFGRGACSSSSVVEVEESFASRFFNSSGRASFASFASSSSSFSALVLVLPPPGPPSAPPFASDATDSGACKNAAIFASTGCVKSTLKSLRRARLHRKKHATRTL
eukprot:29915-Pelagococcus_subviridis.AAC.3